MRVGWNSRKMYFVLPGWMWRGQQRFPHHSFHKVSTGIYFEILEVPFQCIFLIIDAVHIIFSAVFLSFCFLQTNQYIFILLWLLPLCHSASQGMSNNFDINMHSSVNWWFTAMNKMIFITMSGLMTISGQEVKSTCSNFWHSLHNGVESVSYTVCKVDSVSFLVWLLYFFL